MYNEDIKRTYIKKRSKECILPNNYLNRQFDKIDEYEKLLNKDAADMTTDEILSYYKLMNTHSLEMISSLNCQLSQYTQWCINNNLSSNNENNFSKIEIDSMKECLNKDLIHKKIIDRKQIIGWCEILPNPKDQVVLLGLFEGMKSKDFMDFVNLTKEDVNGNVLTLFNGREISVSDELINYIQDSINENTYYSISGNMTKTMSLLDDGHVIKNYPNTKQGTTQFIKGRVIYNSITRSLKYIGVNGLISANDINESGKIHMIKSRSRELNITPMEYLYSNHIKEVEHRFNCRIVRSVFSLKYEDYL